jgi:hypothetical protein
VDRYGVHIDADGHNKSAMRISIIIIIKRPGRKADHSPPAGAEVKSDWS